MRDRIRKALRRFLGLGELAELHTVITKLEGAEKYHFRLLNAITKKVEAKATDQTLSVRTDLLELTGAVNASLAELKAENAVLRQELADQRELVSGLCTIAHRHDDHLMDLFTNLAVTRAVMQPMLEQWRAHQPANTSVAEPFTQDELDKLEPVMRAREEDEKFVREQTASKAVTEAEFVEETIAASKELEKADQQ